MLGQLLLGDRSHGRKQQEDTANVDRWCNRGAETQKAAERDAAINSGESLVDYTARAHINEDNGCQKKTHTQKKKRQIKKMILSGRLPYNHKPVHLQHLIDSMSESNQQMFPKVQVLYGNPSLLISNNLILDMFTPR